MRKVFVNAGGQWDNIGDSLLRRAYLDALRPLGRLHVFVGADAGYASGLGIRPGDVAYTSRVRWLLRTLLAGAFTRSVFAVNTGEVVGTSEELRKIGWHVPVARLFRARGGRVVMTGLSVRPGSDPALTPLGPLAALAAAVSWRDAWSREAFGVGEVAPDWAFDLGGASDRVAGASERPLIAVSMRGDRPAPDADWYAAVRALAAETGCALRVVVQVQRDLERAQELAEGLDAELVRWPEGADHATQESTVRALYRDCRAVLSDRIHALIVGYTEGAIPVGTTTSSPAKVQHTLSVVTDVPVWPSAPGAEPERWRAVLREGAQLAVDLDAARASTARVRAVMRDAALPAR